MQLRLTALNSLILCLLCSCSSGPQEYIGEPSGAALVAHGRTLAQGIAACGYCHGEDATPGSILSGGRSQSDIYGEVQAANLTPAKSGIRDWDTQSLLRAIRSSINRDGVQLSKDVHRGYEWLSDADAISIVAYLKNLPPFEHEVDRRSVTALERNTMGFFESHPEMKGFVPTIDPRFKVQYGEYLTENVARCQSCHNSPGTTITDEQYLVGGKTIKNEHGEKVSPGISGSKVYGLGEWSEAHIVSFLQTGETPEHRMVDPNFCPIQFYRNATQEDLEAIAAYLKTVPANE